MLSTYSCICFFVINNKQGNLVWICLAQSFLSWRTLELDHLPNIHLLSSKGPGRTATLRLHPKSNLLLETRGRVFPKWRGMTPMRLSMTFDSIQTDINLTDEVRTEFWVAPEKTIITFFNLGRVTEPIVLSERLVALFCSQIGLPICSRFGPQNPSSNSVSGHCSNCMSIFPLYIRLLFVFPNSYHDYG